MSGSVVQVLKTISNELRTQLLQAIPDSAAFPGLSLFCICDATGNRYVFGARNEVWHPVHGYEAEMPV